MVIVIFGGSFDPPHNGHLALYKCVKQHIKFNKFIVVPTCCSPFKKNTQINSFPESRLTMTKLLFDKYQDIIVDDFEIKKTKIVNEKINSSVVFSIQTINYLINKYPKAKMYFAIGYDQYLDFPRWKSWRQILTKTQLLVVSRYNKIKQLNPLKDWKLFDVKNDDKIINNIKLLHMPLINCSSTKLRDYFDPKYIPKSVLMFMQQSAPYMPYIREVNKISNKRYDHTQRVIKMANYLLKRNYSSVVRQQLNLAAIYHDICKEWSDNDIKSFVGKYDKKKFPSIHCLHGLAASKWLKQHNYVNDPAVLNAITNHVVPPEKPDFLTMILYLADKLEEKRTKKDLPENRKKLVNEALINYQRVFDKILLFNKRLFRH
ncbi:MAG: nicotinate (nicotinamide) nucleotide adenylyltransferase [Mycoplasmataceae bacterium]|nr:nicotinate (nicotinamide) nucleotide adenylyltransferase [Mycoplasmataceae bacterium]